MIGSLMDCLSIKIKIVISPRSEGIYCVAWRWYAELLWYDTSWRVRSCCLLLSYHRFFWRYGWCPLGICICKIPSVATLGPQLGATVLCASIFMINYEGCSMGKSCGCFAMCGFPRERKRVRLLVCLGWNGCLDERDGWESPNEEESHGWNLQDLRCEWPERHRFPESLWREKVRHPWSTNDVSVSSRFQERRGSASGLNSPHMSYFPPYDA